VYAPKEDIDNLYKSGKPWRNHLLIPA
jgi:hypothetical protein